MSDQMDIARDKAAVMNAFAAGHEIESKFKDGNNWQVDSFPTWNWEEYDYRIKTAKKWRAWRHYEIPVGVAIRLKSQPSIKGVILRSGDNYYTNSIDQRISSNPETLLTYEYSTDFGKTWQPCGIEVT